MKIRTWRHAVWGSLLGAATMAPVQAFDQVVVSAGVDQSDRVDAQVYRLGLRDHWRQRWWESDAAYLSGYWELDAGYFDADGDSLGDVGLNAALRWQSKGHWSPFAEFGSGAHYFSETRLEGRTFSTGLQFGSWAGLGLRFGEQRRYELGYRFVHYSNASIKKPNDGLNVHLIHLGWRF